MENFFFYLLKKHFFLLLREAGRHSTQFWGGGDPRWGECASREGGEGMDPVGVGPLGEGVRGRPKH